MEVNKWRLIHLAAAEAIDAWRVVPRLMVTAYAYMLAYMIVWYKSLKPYIIPDCIANLGPELSANISECLVQAPTTQHTALITAVIGISAGVFGFYANTGRNWSQGVYVWPVKPGEAPPPQYIPYNPYPPYDPYQQHGGYNNPYIRPQDPPPAAKPPPGDNI